MKVVIDFVGGWSMILHDPQGKNRYHKGSIISAFRLPNNDLDKALLSRLVQINADLTFEKSYVFVMVKNSNIENIKFFL